MDVERLASGMSRLEALAPELNAEKDYLRWLMGWVAGDYLDHWTFAEVERYADLFLAEYDRLLPDAYESSKSLLM